MKYNLDIQFFATDDVARALAVGAKTQSKIYTDDEIKKLAGGFVFKGKVATRSALPTIVNNGWVYLIEDENQMVAYYSGEWINYSTAIAWGSIKGDLDDQEDLKEKLDTLALITETGNNIAVTVDSEYKVTTSLYDKNGNLLSNAMIDLPIESVIISGRYDEATKSLILTLQNGNKITIPIEGLISGLATEAYVDAADAILEALIDSEGEIRELKDNELLNEINIETTRAIFEEANLQLEIDSEGTRAKAKELELLNAINDEIARAVAAELNLQNLLDSEATIRLTNDTTLQTNIDNENTRAEAKEAELQLAIDSEGSRAIAKETELETEIDNHEDRITIIEGDYLKNADRVALKAYVDSEDNLVKEWADNKFLTSEGLSSYRKSADQDVIDANQNARLVAIEGQEAYWNAKSDFSGKYDDLQNKPTIPTKVGDLTNDVGYITNSYHDATKQDKLPTVVNDRYLHTNSSTGALEWSEASGEGGLPTTGGTMTGPITLQNTYIAGSGTNNSLNIYGSSNISSGASISLQNLSTGEGNFEVRACDGTTGRILQGTKDGKLTWCDKQVLAKNYSTESDKYLHVNTSGELEWSAGSSAGVTGVKGSAESTYRTGNVNLTAANLGAATTTQLTDGSVTKVGTATKGSAYQPIYLSSGTPTNCAYYAGGTRITLNGNDKYGLDASFYAPLTSADSGKLLASGGAGAAPVWTSPIGSWNNISYSGSSGLVFSPYSWSGDTITFTTASGHIVKYRIDALGRFELSMRITMTATKTLAAKDWRILGYLNYNGTGITNGGSDWWGVGIIYNSDQGYVPVEIHIGNTGIFYIANTLTSSALTLNGAQLQATVFGISK